MYPQFFFLNYSIESPYILSLIVLTKWLYPKAAEPSGHPELLCCQSAQHCGMVGGWGKMRLAGEQGWPQD